MRSQASRRTDGRTDGKLTKRLNEALGLVDVTALACSGQLDAVSTVCLGPIHRLVRTTEGALD